VSGERFLIDVGTPTIELTVDEIWPQGFEAPENPTAADVIEAMKESSGESIRRLLMEWGFDSDLAVEVYRLGEPRDRAAWR
jgi:hypothetical protein